MPSKPTRRSRRVGGDDTTPALAALAAPAPAAVTPTPDPHQPLKSLYLAAIDTLLQSVADLVSAKTRLFDTPLPPALSADAVKSRRAFLYNMFKIQLKRVKAAHDNLRVLSDGLRLLTTPSLSDTANRAAAYATVRDTLKAIAADPRICRVASVSAALDELIATAEAEAPVPVPAPVLAGGRPRRRRGAGLCVSRPAPAAAADPVAESKELTDRLNAIRAALGLAPLQPWTDADDAAIEAELAELTPAAPLAGGAAPRVRFVIERLDVNGDGIPDGDLVKEYQGDRLVAQKFVALDRLKQIAENAVAAQVASPAPAAAGRPQKIVYERAPAHPETKPIVVQSDTSFGHYVKAGAALSLGDTAMDALLSGLAGLFSGSEGGSARRRARAP